MTEPDISIILPAWGEAANLDLLLPELRQTLECLRVRFEILVVDGGSRDNTEQVCEKWGARFLLQQERGYGGALLAGLDAAAGKYVATMDADGSHPPALLEAMWPLRAEDCVVIASRYLPQSRSEAEPFRKVLSFILNRTFGLVLGIPARDISSGYRLYPRGAVPSRIKSRQFDVVQEILAMQHFAGYRMSETPLHYRPRKFGNSKARVVAFGKAYLRTLGRMFVQRFSLPPERARLGEKLDS